MIPLAASVAAYHSLCLCRPALAVHRQALSQSSCTGKGHCVYVQIQGTVCTHVQLGGTVYMCTYVQLGGTVYMCTYVQVGGTAYANTSILKCIRSMWCACLVYNSIIHAAASFTCPCSVYVPL